MKPKAILLAVSLALTGAIALFTHPEPRLQMWDGQFYRAMAGASNVPVGQLARWERAPISQRSDKNVDYLAPENGLRQQPPFAYRVLAPALARVIPGGVDQGFYVVTFLSLWMAAFLFGLVAQEMAGLWAGLAAVGIFALNPSTDRLYLFSYEMVDPLTLALIALGVFALWRRNRVLFFGACLLGVFAKEAVLPLLLAYPIVEWLDRRRIGIPDSRFKMRPSTLAWAVGIGGAWLAFTRLLPVPVDRYSLLDGFRGVGQAKEIVVAAAVLFGPLLLSLGRQRKESVALIPLAVAAVLAAFFVGDETRTVVYALPLVLMSSVGASDLAACYFGQVALLYVLPLRVAAPLALIVGLVLVARRRSVHSVRVAMGLSPSLHEKL